MLQEVASEEVEAARTIVLRGREQLAGLVKSVDNLEKKKAGLQIKIRCLSVILQIRKFFVQHLEWKLLIAMTVPCLVAAVVVVSTHTIGIPTLGIVAMTVVGAGFVAAAAVVALYFPADKTISHAHKIASDTFENHVAQLYETRAKRAQIEKKLAQAESEYASLNAQFQKLERAKSREHQLRRLNMRNWKAMRSIDLENFLAEVFETLDYAVETTNTTGDQGVDLIVTRDAWRIAVQIKGYESSVGNKAVQEVFAGMAHYKCNACVVVTNSVFTRGACELAESTACVLVDENLMFQFIMGRFDLVEQTGGRRVAERLTTSE